jgi:protein-S-isoprenylcysteine O-methyltransferase Ste14
MANARDLFHKISYTQYPLMGAAMIFMYRPLLADLKGIWGDYNLALVFLGLSLSMATLQDTRKSQNKFSQRIWESPRKSKLFLTYLAVLAAFFIGLGLVALFLPESNPIYQLAFGLLALGVGLLGVLKSAIEMAENHQAAKPKS